MDTKTSLDLHINAWSLLDEVSPDTEEGLGAQLSAIKNADFLSIN